MTNDAKISEVACKLWRDLYEESFRGKSRGRFILSREQLKQALQVERLHQSTIIKLQDEALSLGLIIIDLDDVFPCIETKVVRGYRRPTSEIFDKYFPDYHLDQSENDDDDDFN
ncbi:hypothetical protein [Gluconobacter kondonii]|uniref:hypothetical protein n=1 Tax=Gluconobacter kondonii TaxID=941463 RepID=UPI001B8CB497|nr:hypothetical protein [Gluconobacter kondonii]MBS1058322.1 hypothetical protein [Gluconobacter kondonii]